MKLKAIKTSEVNGKMQFVGDRAPVASGYGMQNFFCAACGDLLLSRMTPEDIKNAVFRCPTCGVYNALQPE